MNSLLSRLQTDKQATIISVYVTIATSLIDISPIEPRICRGFRLSSFRLENFFHQCQRWHERRRCGISLYCIVLYCIVLYCIVLYCSVCMQFWKREHYYLQYSISNLSFSVTGWQELTAIASMNQVRINSQLFLGRNYL